MHAILNIAWLQPNTQVPICTHSMWAKPVLGYSG